jgi:hypothetical protein
MRKHYKTADLFAHDFGSLIKLALRKPFQWQDAPLTYPPSHINLSVAYDLSRIIRELIRF